jgi:hypothetical protein
MKDLLKDSLPLIGAGLGDKLGVRIKVEGNQAWTDGKTICIPSFQTSSKEEKDAVLGFMSHEAAHIKFDSFRGISRSDINVPIRKTFWNIFEDLRIEKAMINSMVGTKKWMNQIWINRQKEGKRKPVSNDAEPIQIINDLLLFHCRVNHRGQTHLMNYLDAATDAFIGKISWKLHNKLIALIDSKLGTLSSSVDAMNLAKEVEMLLEQHEENEEADQDNEPQQEESNEDSDSEPNEGEPEEQSGDADNSESDENTDGEGQGNSEDEEPTSNPGCSNETSQDESDSEQEDGDSNSPQSGQLEQPNGPSNEEVEAIVQSILNASEDDVDDEMDDFAQSMETLAKANVGHEVAIPKSTNLKAQGGIGLDHLQKCKRISNQLSATLQGVVQQNLTVRSRTANSGNRLNTKVLYRAGVADPRLFKTKAKKKDVDSIVEIAVDNSGSMYHQRTRDGDPILSVAKDASLALALALDKINGVNVTASAFPTNGSGYGVYNLLSENEKVSRLADRLMHIQADGDHTPSATAMWHCVKTVLDSQKKRKVILFITDGFPNENEEGPLFELVRKAEKNNIVVIGIAIGHIAHRPTEFKKYFSNAVFIHDTNELKKEMFEIAKQVIVD